MNNCGITVLVKYPKSTKPTTNPGATVTVEPNATGTVITSANTNFNGTIAVETVVK